MSIEANKTLAKSYWLAFESGDLDAVAIHLHPDHVFHPEGGRAQEDLEERKAEDVIFFQGFSQIEVTVEDQIAEADRVASRVRMVVTHSGGFQDLPATGKRFPITLLDVVRIQDGKIVEEWTEFDWQSLLGQLRSGG